MCSRAHRFDEASSRSRNTKSTGRPSNSSASPAISKSSSAATVAGFSNVASKSISLCACCSPRENDPKTARWRNRCLRQKGASLGRISSRNAVLAAAFTSRSFPDSAPRASHFVSFVGFCSNPFRPAKGQRTKDQRVALRRFQRYNAPTPINTNTAVEGSGTLATRNPTS